MLVSYHSRQAKWHCGRSRSCSTRACTLESSSGAVSRITRTARPFSTASPKMDNTFSTCSSSEVLMLFRVR